jgi:hypothetical protein
MIEAALEESWGRISGPSGAAGKLGMPRTTLESKIKSLRINKHQSAIGRDTTPPPNSSGHRRYCSRRHRCALPEINTQPPHLGD